MFRSTCFALVAMAAIVCLIGSTAQAAVPSLMNYGGILTNGGGAPQVGTFNVTFTVYDAATGGTALWSEVQSVTTDAQGRFNVLLGSSAPLVDSVFRGPDRYLGITVSPDPEMSARARISTVGFAFRAATLDHVTLSGYNTLVGKDAGNSTMMGDGNTAIGSGALDSITSGEANTACGKFALWRNSDGVANTAVGASAMEANSTGGENTAIGSSALLGNMTGGGNTATGKQAMEGNQSGNNNCAFGVGALLGNVSGSLNTAIGIGAMLNTWIGSGNTACGANALQNTQLGDSNTAFGAYALRSNFSGMWNTGLGHRADVSTSDLVNATAIGAYAVVDNSNKIRLGNSAVTVIEGQVAYTFTSDQNSKENFREVDGDEVLAKLRDLEVQSWNYKGQDPEHFRHYGPVAQDFYAAFGKDDVGTVGTPTTINSGDMAGILMIAVQALEKRTAEISDLKREIEELKRQIQKN